MATNKSEDQKRIEMWRRERLTECQARMASFRSQQEFTDATAAKNVVRQHYLTGDYNQQMAISALVDLGYGREGAKKVVEVWDDKANIISAHV